MRTRHFDIVDSVLVVHTMNARCLHTCICPLDGVIQLCPLHAAPQGGNRRAVSVGAIFGGPNTKN